jgi:hypothetical protein
VLRSAFEEVEHQLDKHQPLRRRKQSQKASSKRRLARTKEFLSLP